MIISNLNRKGETAVHEKDGKRNKKYLYTNQERVTT